LSNSNRYNLFYSLWCRFTPQACQSFHIRLFGNQDRGLRRVWLYICYCTGPKSDYLSVLSVCRSVCPEVCLHAFLDISLSVCPSIYLSVCLSVCLSAFCRFFSPSTVCLSAFCRFFSPSIGICLFVYFCPFDSRIWRHCSDN